MTTFCGLRRRVDEELWRSACVRPAGRARGSVRGLPRPCSIKTLHQLLLPPTVDVMFQLACLFDAQYSSCFAAQATVKLPVTEIIQ